MTGPFKVLDAADPGDLSLWKSLWRQWPEQESMAYPEYVRLFARAEDQVMCAALVSDHGGVMFPFLLRAVSEEPWAGQDEHRFDIVTPYGYGGAFAWGCDEDDDNAFWESFDAWAAEHGIVTSFARLSLFEDQRLPFRGIEEDNMPNVIRTLDLSPEELWRDYAHKVRKNVNTARRAGLEVQFDTCGESLDRFIDIYRDTMQRREAAESFHFPRDFFETIIEKMPGQYLFCHVYAGQRMVSTELVLLSSSHMYSFLGGTLPEAFASRPNDLLKHAMIEWGMAQGKSAFVLGGGYGREDGIFQYKRYFAPRGVVSFKVGKRIYDEAAYRQLVQQRQDWEVRHGRSWMPAQDYFPGYRG